MGSQVLADVLIEQIAHKMLKTMEGVNCRYHVSGRPLRVR